MAKPITAFRRAFTETGEYAAERAATAFLVEHGFSVGRMQGHELRGILFGQYDIQKWRNLRPADREALHGHMAGYMRDGPVYVVIYLSAPVEALTAVGVELTSAAS